MKKLPPSHAEALANIYANMAGRMLGHITSGKAKASGAEQAIKDAHDACARAMFAIEKANPQ